MIISKSVLIIRFGLSIAKSRQAEALSLYPYTQYPWSRPERHLELTWTWSGPKHDKRIAMNKAESWLTENDY